ncbi:MAG TPA: GNAT family N-acetyltransferase [Herpetosiphonaceae bacterium]
MSQQQPGAVTLRDVHPADLSVFFEQQLDPEANRMAAFTVENPADRAAFDARWERILADPSIINKTIVSGGEIAGHIAQHAWFGDPEVTYWLGREFWGRGVASAALAQFLALAPIRPLYARAAKDHAATLRVLEKCGFAIAGEDKGFANARNAEIEEWILILR